MPSTYSANLKIELIADGEQSGTWGDTTNSNFQNVFEDAIVGRSNPIFTADADLTLTADNTVATQKFRHLYLNVTSSVSLSTTRSLIVPDILKPYIVENNTTGGQAITVKTAAGTGITIPNGKKCPVYVDNTNVVIAWDYLPSLTVGGNVSTGGTLDVAGVSTFAADSIYSGTGQVKLPVGTTAQRSGTPVDGMIRGNSTDTQFEGYIGGKWGSIGGAQAGGAIYENKQEITADYTMTTGYNGESVGPISVASGVSVTVPSGSRWVVL